MIELAQQQAEVLAKFGQTEADITTGETLYTQLKAANEAQEQYKFTRASTTAERRQLFRQLYDGVNRINQMGQAVYGPETPNGLLFRSNWGLGKRSSGEQEEQPSSEKS